LKFDLVVAIFSNLVTNDYKSHVVINGLVTFWLISTSVCDLDHFDVIIGNTFLDAYEINIFRNGVRAKCGFKLMNLNVDYNFTW
jgi:hypothetical protein